MLVNLQKHYQAKDAESGSGFDPPAIPFIPKALSLKTENAQEFTLRISPTAKKSTYKYKAITFCNQSPEDVLEWEKKLYKVIKNKPVDAADGHFNCRIRCETLMVRPGLVFLREMKKKNFTRTKKIQKIQSSSIKPKLKKKILKSITYI